MKSLTELEQIRKKTAPDLKLRKETADDKKIAVGMADCGIAAGAKPVLYAFLEGIHKNNISDVYVTQSDCIGLCKYEPVVEVYINGQEKVTYVNMTPEKAAKVIEEHILGGKIVSEYTLENVD